VGGINGEIPLQWAVRHPKGAVNLILCIKFNYLPLDAF